MNLQSMMNMERPYLRARRRVRQRVDAGEPRNSYSSIPGFSFRSMQGSSGPNVSTTPPINATPPHHPFLAAAAARMNGFNAAAAAAAGGAPPGHPGGHPGSFGPPHHMMGPSPFFRPPFPHGPPGDFHPGGPPHMMPPHPHFMGHHRQMGPFGPRPFMLMQQPQQQPPVQPNQQLPPVSMANGGGGLPIPVSSSPNCSSSQNSGFLQNFHQSVVGDLRAGMAAAACAAAAAVQRAQILMQAKAKKDSLAAESINGDSNDKEPLETEPSLSSPAVSESATKADQGPIEEGESGDGASIAAKKDLKTKEDDLSGNSVSEVEASGERDDVSGGEGDDGSGNAGQRACVAGAGPSAAGDGCDGGSGAGDVALLQERKRANPSVMGSNTEELLTVEGELRSKEQVCINSNSNSAVELTNAAPFLKEIIQGKLALAAAAAVASRHQQDNMDMEQALAAARDFTRHNNNDHLKDPSKAPNLGHQDAKGQAEFLQNIFRMQQQLHMSLNNSRQQPPMPKQLPVRPQPTDSEDEACKIDDDDIAASEEEEEELPIDIHGGSSDNDALSGKSQTSPRSPSSDAGLSTASSAGGKAGKAMRLDNIVSSLQRASPSLIPKENGKEASGAGNPPVNGCKKRKLYQPVQAKVSDDDDNIAVSEVEQPDIKRSREPSANDENADPTKIINGLGEAASLPAGLTLPPTLPGNNNLLPNNLPVQMHYMEMARKFLQDQQDKATKEAITKEILADTVGKNNEMAEKLVSISPELKGLADILKSEITASLALIIDSIVGRFLQHTRNNNSTAASVRPPLAGMKHTSPFLTGRDASDSPTSLLPPMPHLKNTNNMTPSGRAPQVRDRSAPRSTGLGPVSMYNPTTPLSTPVTTIPTSSAFPLPPSLTLRPSPGLLQQAPIMPSSATSSSLNNNHSEDDHHSSPSPTARDMSPPEQDEALSLVVTPKKRRHKVTDTRITPRTLSRVLGGEPLAELHKQFPNFQGFKGMQGNLDGNPNATNSPRLTGAPMPHPLFPGLPAPPGLLAGLPTSVAIPNPSLADFNPFSSFYSPPHLPVSSSGNTITPGFPPSAVREHNKPKFMSSTPPLDKSRHQFNQSRERHHSSSDVGRDMDGTTPPSLLRHPSLLSRGSPDFAARLRDDRERDQEEFDRMGPSMPFGMSGFSGMGGEATSSTLTPMHLRKAKLMFFWVRYPSSAILKMYFPDIKFNKNNTAQLVKWFSNFREFFFIQMEKYARQALSEGAKSDTELHVTEDSELYRVISLHYNRNNHIEVPQHFLPVVEMALREFFLSVQAGKDTEASWKKQIYKIIQRYDESIPENFKTPEFLRSLE